MSFFKKYGGAYHDSYIMLSDPKYNEAVLFINHGGQNSVIQGLQYGVPQLIVPGKVFERKYNAQSLADLETAIVLSEKEFIAPVILNKANEMIENDEIKNKAEVIGKKLSEQGGFANIEKSLIFLIK